MFQRFVPARNVCHCLFSKIEPVGRVATFSWISTKIEHNFACDMSISACRIASERCRAFANNRACKLKEAATIKLKMIMQSLHQIRSQNANEKIKKNHNLCIEQECKMKKNTHQENLHLQKRKASSAKNMTKNLKHECQENLHIQKHCLWKISSFRGIICDKHNICEQEFKTKMSRKSSSSKTSFAKNLNL